MLGIVFEEILVSSIKNWVKRGKLTKSEIFRYETKKLSRLNIIENSIYFSFTPWVTLTKKIGSKFENFSQNSTQSLKVV